MCPFSVYTAHRLIYLRTERKRKKNGRHVTTSCTPYLPCILYFAVIVRATSLCLRLRLVRGAINTLH